MDRREREILQDEVDRGTLNVGIRRVEEGAYEKESRLPLVKGGSAGLAVGAAVAIFYGKHVGFRSPLGLFVDDYVLVMIGIMAAGTVIGALLMWGFAKATRRKRPPQDTA